MEIGQKVRDGEIVNVNRKTVDIEFSNFRKWHSRNEGTLYNDVIVRYDKSYLIEADYPPYDYEILPKFPGEKKIHGKVL